ncbi:Nif3-like dinuclear metal center hexameric protein [Thorsellia kenyensis]|uniref:Nif3-like dinuclear metal center hexameric protein n=1 Tax=Thorsellia kenyensis TaxID=1549888 RepID=A0ABV6CFF6_9GAMM
MITLKQLLTSLDALLEVENYQDYAPNGLQVEGKKNITKIVTGVTASEALIEKAIELNADAILVHHGYFWKNEPVTITGMKKRRIEKLIKHDINLLAYHLPLDGHMHLGNNVQLAQLLDIKINGEIMPLVLHGEFERPMTWQEVSQLLHDRLDRVPLHSGGNVSRLIKTVAWCTGGGQGFIDKAAEFGVDAYLSGEISESTVHIAREMGIHFFSAGHHATERYGIKALGEWVKNNFGIEVIFVDVDNPA